MFKITILLLSLFLHTSSFLCQESLHTSTLHLGDSSYTTPLQTIGVSVDEEKLKDVSNSILTAENWLRNHVLSYYPSTNITSVIVTNKLLCDGGNTRNRDEVVKLVMDSMKNLHHSLTRWGLEREIKVTVSVSSNCLHQSHLKPVFSLLEKLNSTYTIQQTQLSDETVTLLTSELEAMNDLNIFRSDVLNVMFIGLKHPKSISRKLSFIDDLWSVSASPPPPPSPEIHPPMISPASSPSHPYGYSLPPCNPYPHGYHAPPPAGGGPMAAPPMVVGGGPVAAPPVVVGKVGGQVAVPPGLGEGVWCVAKPSVPVEKLQVGLDYACGAGGADCGPIRPNGSCYLPDSVVAHASFAFNSYWQKNKRKGGVCGFEGMAMLISSDPSYLHCHFILG